MISRVARIEISLRARSRWLPFLLAIGAASLLLAAETLLVGTVFSFESPSTGHLMLALDSDDPWLQFRLGQVSKDTDPAENVRRLRRATELSPHSRFYWENLAAACESTGDTQCADQATERLLKLCPMVPYYHQLAGQSYLRRNRLDDALRQFRRLIELDPVYASEAWGSLQSVLDPDLIFQKLLTGGKDSQVQAESEDAASSAPTSGMDSKVQVEYVDFLSNQGNNDAAYRIWKLVAANRRLFPLSSAQPYLERLIDLGRIEEAARVWQDLEHLGIVARPAGDQEDNLVFNGDFEQLPLNAGFDWRTGLGTYFALDFASSGAYRGAHCLRVEFPVGRNNEYEPVYQVVPVLPSRTYRLEAYVRSQEITSTSGPCLRVTDTQHPSAVDAVTESAIGTTGWHPLRLSFSTGPETQAVRLALWRPRGREFPMEISGTFWLDAVSLRPM